MYTSWRVIETKLHQGCGFSMLMLNFAVLGPSLALRRASLRCAHKSTPFPVLSFAAAALLTLRTL